MRSAFLGIIAIAFVMPLAQVSQAQAADFKIGFSWGNLKKCTTGRPRTVSNPKFSLKGVPKGTKTIRFVMKDLNVPSYRHGGGKAKYSGGSSIPSGAFKYKSPCPPNGKHTYQWTATAIGDGGKKLATAKARRSYP
ncbi:phospholipid-binding protein [Hoeflea sp.]|uniref:phospholipid-binding protein n=1 Tax=Hoeflea sp. TaxID=1940281 RepID=UPI003A90B749